MGPGNGRTLAQGHLHQLGGHDRFHDHMWRHFLVQDRTCAFGCKLGIDCTSDKFLLHIEDKHGLRLQFGFKMQVTNRRCGTTYVPSDFSNFLFENKRAENAPFLTSVFALTGTTPESPPPPTAADRHALSEHVPSLEEKHTNPQRHLVVGSSSFDGGRMDFYCVENEKLPPRIRYFACVPISTHHAIVRMKVGQKNGSVPGTPI